MKNKISLSLAIKVFETEDGWAWQITDHFKKIKYQPKRCFETPEEAQANLVEVLSEWERR